MQKKKTFYFESKLLEFPVIKSLASFFKYRFGVLGLNFDFRFREQDFRSPNFCYVSVFSDVYSPFSLEG